MCIIFLLPFHSTKVQMPLKHHVPGPVQPLDLPITSRVVVGREHSKIGSVWTGLPTPSRGQVKLNVYSGLMSSCQESAHGLRSLLAEHNRGARARRERRRGRSSRFSREFPLHFCCWVEILHCFISAEALEGNCNWS